MFMLLLNNCNVKVFCRSFFSNKLVIIVPTSLLLNQKTILYGLTFLPFVKNGVPPFQYIGVGYLLSFVAYILQPSANFPPGDGVSKLFFYLRRRRRSKISQSVCSRQASRAFQGAPSSVWPLALPTNIRLGWKGLFGTNTLAFQQHK